MVEPMGSLLVVSVPLRGKYRGEDDVLFIDCGSDKVWFPSPCGVNIVAKAGALLGAYSRRGVSVPLRGKYRGEGLSIGWFDFKGNAQCFRPLAG